MNAKFIDREAVFSFAASFLTVVLLLTVSPEPSPAAEHRILHVGPGLTLNSPSDAAAVVNPGDTIEIAAGKYDDCAVWPNWAPAITIRSAGDGPVVITGTTCEEKALFVIKADDVVIQGITFEGAKAFFHNGAGIRAEGRNLTVESAIFLDNEEGILAAPQPSGTIIIRDSFFQGNGNCDVPAGCAHAVYVNTLDRLVVENSTFIGQHIGHHIKSRALHTELVGDSIVDGPNGTASYLVDIPNGGALIMRNNILEKGPKSDNPAAAVSIGEEGTTNATPEILIEGNRFTNDNLQGTAFVRNLTGTPAVLRENILGGSVR